MGWEAKAEALRNDVSQTEETSGVEAAQQKLFADYSKAISERVPQRPSKAEEDAFNDELNKKWDDHLTLYASVWSQNELNVQKIENLGGGKVKGCLEKAELDNALKSDKLSGPERLMVQRLRERYDVLINQHRTDSFMRTNSPGITSNDTYSFLTKSGVIPKFDFQNYNITKSFQDPSDLGDLRNYSGTTQENQPYKIPTEEDTEVTFPNGSKLRKEANGWNFYNNVFETKKQEVVQGATVQFDNGIVTIKYGDTYQRVQKDGTPITYVKKDDETASFNADGSVVIQHSDQSKTTFNINGCAVTVDKNGNPTEYRQFDKYGYRLLHARIVNGEWHFVDPYNPDVNWNYKDGVSKLTGAPTIYPDGSIVCVSERGNYLFKDGNIKQMNANELADLQKSRAEMTELTSITVPAGKGYYDVAKELLQKSGFDNVTHKEVMQMTRLLKECNGNSNFLRTKDLLVNDQNYFRVMALREQMKKARSV